MIPAQCIILIRGKCYVAPRHIVQRLLPDASEAILIMNQPEALYRLQEVELEIMRTQQRLKQIADTLANDETVQQAQNQVTAAQNQLNPLKSRLRELEHEIQTNESKTRTTEQQLYSGTVKNTKEMQDMQQEIEALKRWHGELETSLLETMMSTEEAETVLQQKEADLSAVLDTRGDEHRVLLQEQAELQAQLSAAKERRQQALKEVNPENLEIYVTMKPRKNYQPVAIMQGNTCSVCGVAQNVAIEREVRRGTQLVNCSNCQRILVTI